MKNLFLMQIPTPFLSQSYKFTKNMKNIVAMKPKGRASSPDTTTDNKTEQQVLLCSNYLDITISKSGGLY
jgi:hypothetical protein